jgi:DNA polymerase-3 subunit gamma/tau
MSGATSPKLHLELMCAKVLVPSSDQTEVGSLARIERLERRIGMGGSEPAQEAPVAPVAPVAPMAAAPTQVSAPAAPPRATVAPETPAPTSAVGSVSASQVRDAWSEILSKVNKQSKSAWMVAFSLTVVDFSDEILTLKFLSQNDLDAFKNASGASDILRKAIFDVLGIQVKFKAQIDASVPTPPVAQAPAVAASQPKTSPIAIVHTEAPDDYDEEPEDDEPSKSEAPAKSRNGMVDESARYGESLLREMLGAEPIVDKNAGK